MAVPLYACTVRVAVGWVAVGTGLVGGQRTAARTSIVRRAFDDDSRRREGARLRAEADAVFGWASL
jgi:hypothetical protein